MYEARNRPKAIVAKLCQTVNGMDAVTEPPGMGLRRV
jgi:hypothetical protein